MLIGSRDLVFAYRAGDVPAFRGISVGLERGECLGIVGGAGAGKSTLAQNFAGLLAPTAGALLLEGREVGRGRSAGRRLTARVAYVPQWPERQLFAATVAEDVAAGLTLPGGDPSRAARVDEALRMAGLEPAAMRGRPVQSLSGAEARKAAIAGALILDRPVLIFDEPTAGLDAASREEVMRLLARLKGEGRTLLVISHRLVDILPTADKLLVLEAGICRWCGRLADALADESPRIDGLLEWPPVLELWRRLKRRCPGLGPPVHDPDEAAARILGCLGYSSPKTSAS